MKPGKKREMGMHVAFSLIVLGVLLISRYYYMGTLREHARAQRGVIALISYFFFLVCIYAGRWFCLKWFHQNKPKSFLLYTLPFFAGILISWYFLVKIGFDNPNLGFFEFSLAYGPFYIIGLITGFLIKLVRAYGQKQLQDVRIKAEQKESELNLLQSQLSPHFLFNTLNNMYGISIADHQRVPALLLKLSDLLRYSVYETKRPFVSLKEELEYIGNYIEFEKIRISDRLLLNTHIEPVDHSGARIAPMVLIVFVENAFKHAKDTFDQKVRVDIDIKIAGGFIRCVVGNSYRKEKDASNEMGLLDESSGLGLANTIKRLDLLYGEQYVLKQYIRNETYIVELSLKIM